MGRSTEVFDVEGRRVRAVTAIARSMTIVVAGALAVAMAAPGVGAHDGPTSHLWLDHIKQLQVPGTINDPGNPVDWTKLKGVPAGIADGKDAGVELAGLGLLKFYSLFAVDMKVIQHRITTKCGFDQAIRKVAQNGKATCSAGPQGLTLRIADTGPMCNSGCTEGTLVLTPGTWAITAQITLVQGRSSVDELFVSCHLDAGGKSDTARYVLMTDSDAELPMQLIATLSSNLHATVNCGDADVGEVHGHDLSIVAIRLAD